MEHLNGTTFEASPAPEINTTTHGASAYTSTSTTQKIQIPISQLSCNLPNPSISYVRAIVTLIWPYSSLTKSLSILLVAPDFRLRNNKGQVKVNFTENVGKRIQESKLGSGDEVILSLEGAEFTTLDDNSDPRTVSYELSYGTKCVVQIRRVEGGEIVLLDIAAQEQQELDAETAALQELQQAELAITGARERIRDEILASPPRSTAFSRSTNGRIKAVQNEYGEWSSPAFIKRARLSYGSLMSDELSSFLGDEEDKGHKNKRRKFEPRESGTWRYMSESRSTSPELAQAQEVVEDEFMAEVAPSAPEPVVEKPRYTTMEIGVQTDDLSFDDAQLEMFRRSTAIGREVRPIQQEPIHMVEEGVQTFGDAEFSPIAFQSPPFSERTSQALFGAPTQPLLFPQASTTPLGQPPSQHLFGQSSTTLLKPSFSQPTTPLGQPSQHQASTTPLGEPPAHNTLTSPLASKSEQATLKVATPRGQWPASMWTDMGYLRPPPVESPTEKYTSQSGTFKSHESKQKEREEKETKSNEFQIPSSPSQTDVSAEDPEGKNTHTQDRDEDDGHNTAAAALEAMSRLRPSTTLTPHHRGTDLSEDLEVDHGVPAGEVLEVNLNETEDKLPVVEKIRSRSPPETEKVFHSPVAERKESMYPELSSPIRSSDTARENYIRQMRKGSIESVDLAGDSESEGDEGAQLEDEGMPDGSEGENDSGEYSEEKPGMGERAEESSEPEDFRRSFNELREQVLEEVGQGDEVEHDKDKLADAQMWRGQLSSQPQTNLSQRVESEDDEDDEDDDNDENDVDKYSGPGVEGEDEGEDEEGEEEDGEEVANFGNRGALLNPRAQQLQPRHSPCDGLEECESQGEEQEFFSDDEVDGDVDAEDYSDDDGENEVEYGSDDVMEGQRYGKPGELHVGDQEGDYDEDEFSREEEDSDLEKYSKGYHESKDFGPIDGRGYMQPPPPSQAPPKKSTPVFIDLLSDNEDEAAASGAAKEASSPVSRLDDESEDEFGSGEEDGSDDDQSKDSEAIRSSDEISQQNYDVIEEEQLEEERTTDPIQKSGMAKWGPPHADAHGHELPVGPSAPRSLKPRAPVKPLGPQQSYDEVSGYEDENATAYETEDCAISQYDGAGDSKPVQHFRVPSEQPEKSSLPTKVESVEPPAPASGDEADVEDSVPVPAGTFDAAGLEPQKIQECGEIVKAAEHIQTLVAEATKEAKAADVTEHKLEDKIDRAVDAELAESKDKVLNEEAGYDVEMTEVSDIRGRASPVPNDTGSVEEVMLPLPETPFIEEDGAEAVDLSRSERHPGLGDHSHDEVGQMLPEGEKYEEMQHRISDPDTEYRNLPPSELERIYEMVEDIPSEADTRTVPAIVIPEDGGEGFCASDVVENEDNDENDDKDNEEEYDEDDDPSNQLFRESIAQYSQESTRIVESFTAMFDEPEDIITTETFNETQQTAVNSVFSQIVEEATSFQTLSITQPPQALELRSPKSPPAQKEVEAEALEHMAEVADKRQFETPEFEEPTASQAVQPTTFHISPKSKTSAKRAAACPDLKEHPAKHTRLRNKYQLEQGNEHDGTEVSSIEVDDVGMEDNPVKYTREHDHDSDQEENNSRRFSPVGAVAGSPAAHTRSHDTQKHCVEDEEGESAKGLPPIRRASSSMRNSELLADLREKTPAKEKENTPVVGVPASSSIENVQQTPSPPKRVTRSRRGTQEQDAAKPVKEGKATRKLMLVVEVPVTSSIENVAETPAKSVTRGRKASVSNTARRGVTPVVEVPASSIEQASPPVGSRVTRSRNTSASRDAKPITPQRRRRAMGLRSHTTSPMHVETFKAYESTVLEPLGEEDEDSQSVIDPGVDLLLLHEGSQSPERRATSQPARPVTRSLSGREVRDEPVELELSGSFLEVTTPVKRVTGLQHNMRSPVLAATTAKLQLRDPGADALLTSSPAAPHTPTAAEIGSQRHNFATPSAATRALSGPGTPDFSDMTPSAIKASITRHLRASLSSYTTLKSIKPLLGKKIDVLAIATSTPSAPQRAKHGPRHWLLKYYVTDPSSSPSITEVSVFRPYKDALPDIKIGDVILLRHFLVKAEAGWGLRSEDASSWAVWKGEKDGEEGVVECRGPPVEYGRREEEHVKVLKRWWRGLDEGIIERMASHGSPAAKLKSSTKR